MSIYSVAVDGPSGAGKSTLSKAVARELGIVYVDTGAIYRTIGYYIFREGIDPKDAGAVVAALPLIHVDMCYNEDGLQHMLLNGEDVTEQIRLPEISMYASAVSAIPPVRDYLLEMQRDMARRSSVIMDGRDIGTVVLPDAQVKILELRGTPKPFEQVLEEMKQRDWADSHRDAAPLQEAEDAIRVDTTDMDFQQSKEAIMQVIRRRTQL